MTHLRDRHRWVACWDCQNASYARTCQIWRKESNSVWACPILEVSTWGSLFFCSTRQVLFLDLRVRYNWTTLFMIYLLVGLLHFFLRAIIVEHYEEKSSFFLDVLIKKNGVFVIFYVTLGDDVIANVTSYHLRY